MIEDSFAEDAKAGTWRYLYYVSYHGDHYDLAWELLQDKWDDYAVKYVENSPQKLLLIVMVFMSQS